MVRGCFTKLVFSVGECKSGCFPGEGYVSFFEGSCIGIFMGMDTHSGIASRHRTRKFLGPFIGSKYKAIVLAIGFLNECFEVS